MSDLTRPDGLFAQVVAASGLSAVFASKALLRACARADVDAPSMTSRDLARLLPEVERALGVFLKQAELATRMESISRLARP